MEAQHKPTSDKQSIDRAQETYKKLIEEVEKLVSKEEYKQAYDIARDAQRLENGKESEELLSEIFIKWNLKEKDNKNPNYIISNIINSSIRSEDRINSSQLLIQFCTQKGSLFISELLEKGALTMIMVFIWNNIQKNNNTKEEENKIVMNSLNAIKLLVDDYKASKSISKFILNLHENFIQSISAGYQHLVLDLLVHTCNENYKLLEILTEKERKTITNKLFLNLKEIKDFNQEIKSIYLMISQFIQNPDAISIFFESKLYDLFIQFSLNEDGMKGPSIITLSKLCSVETSISKIQKSWNDYIDEDNEKAFKLLYFLLYANWGVAFGFIEEMGKDWLQEMVELIHFEKNQIQINFLECLSLLCTQEKGRDMIKNIPTFNFNKFNLEHFMVKALVTLVHSKLILIEKDVPINRSITIAKELIGIVKNEQIEKIHKFNAIESLTYLSLIAEIKELLVYDSQEQMKTSFCVYLLDLLQNCIDDPKSNSANIFGMVALMSNIISYPKQLTEEQKQVQKLQNLTKGKKESGEKEDPLEKDETIIKRIKFLVNVDGFISIFKSLIFNLNSLNIYSLAVNSYLYISNDKDNHGLLVKHGAVKALFYVIKNSVSKFHINKEEKMSDNLRQINLISIQVLAKLSIHMNPSITFPGQQPFDLISPFLSIIDVQTRVAKNSDKHKDNLKLNELASSLQKFECLLGLTNLASINEEIRANIIENHKGLPIIEYCLFDNNTEIQRASMECLCNLAASRPFLISLLENETRCNEKIHLFLAFSNQDTDPKMQLAATGTLAIMSGATPLLCTKIVSHDRSKDLLQGLVNDFPNFCTEMEYLRIPLLHRIVEIFRSLSLYLPQKDHQKFLNICTQDIATKLIQYSNGSKFPPAIESSTILGNQLNKIKKT